MILTDQVGREVSLPGTPGRIISLVPSLTEALCDLKLADQIVGRTRFCLHPRAMLSHVPVMGGTKKINPEKIRRARPDIILCNKEENTFKMVGELEKIAPVHVSDVSTVDDALELFRHYGDIFKKEEEAENLIERISNKRSKLLDDNGQKSKRAAYLIWKEPWMLAGKGTFIDHMMGLCGLHNVIQQQRYPAIDIHEIKATAPEVVLLSSEPYPFRTRHLHELKKYFPDSRILLVDGSYFSWYSGRIADAFNYFTQIQSVLYR
ncbi:ABC transporter substrate-binding protein [Robertkochia aurantiaca]|uniref:ABC transporter substrate-binding protein n=1 Tax=Robertkochia aurantiaca TaxID=2873700 RepID=UPI001CCAE838|nr:helical backbone metal receptor [Robertkochia sp. 3YJGBD-33]